MRFLSGLLIAALITIGLWWVIYWIIIIIFDNFPVMP